MKSKGMFNDHEISENCDQIIQFIKEQQNCNNQKLKQNYKQKRPNKNLPIKFQFIVFPYPRIMDTENIIQQYQAFQAKLKTRQRIRILLDSKFQAVLDIMEYVILSKFEKNAKNLFKEKKNKNCDKLFKRVFKELIDGQKIYYYNMIVTHLENITDQNLTPPKKQAGNIKAPGYSKTYSKIGWKEVHLKVDFDKMYLYVERDQKLNAYDLRFYLIRKSKATEYHCFVLEAINQVITEKGQQIHIGFKDSKVFKLWFDSILKVIEYEFWQKIKNMMFAPQLVEMLQTKAHQDQTKEQRNTQLLMEKLCQSTFTTSQKYIDAKVDQRMTRSMKKITSRDQLSEKSLDKSSCKSIQIKSHSPRSSLKGQEVRLEMEENDQEDGNQTFRSFAQLTGQDIEDFNEENEESPIFLKLFPDYVLKNLSEISNQNKLLFTSNDGRLKIYSNTQNAKKIKAFVEFDKNSFSCSFEEFAALFCTPEFYKEINTQIEEINAKTILTSDKCAILYQKHIAYNRLYRCRDFVLLRHHFRKGNKIYVIDKSVQDTNIPPFTTIVRGQLAIVYELSMEGDQMKIVIDALVQNFGYLKDMQELNINIKFFKGFQNIQGKLKQLKGKSVSTLFEPLPKKQESMQNITFNFDKIDKKKNLNKSHENSTDTPQEAGLPNEQNKLVLQQKTEQPSKEQLPIESQRKNSTEQTFGDVQKVTENIDEIAQSVQKMEIQGEISMIQEPKSKADLKIIRQFDHEGRVIVSNDYLFKKHEMGPCPADRKDFVYLKNANNEHPIWKGNWQFLEQGGLKFINKKQIEDQKGVLKFILSQVAKNLVSGKSILNISLPVDIFSSQSNLQRFIFSMGYAPYLLQKASKMDELDRFLYTVVFGMTNSPLYLEMEKPFNPIIGETFQCSINGCPAYAEQISHHPPIAAFTLYGRGYRISAQIESKMKLNINSGTGSNSGVYRVKYEDGQEICYICPCGEVSGLAYGDRKFNMVGKAYGWSERSGLFLQIAFNPKKGRFFEKQSAPVDYVQGRAFKVKYQFIQSFVKNSYSGTPKKSQIIKELGKFHGRWNRELKYENRSLFSYDTEFPLELEYQASPLASDANWRQDIAYRRLQQITAAQTWKEKLQIEQRNFRKLREKYLSNKK